MVGSVTYFNFFAAEKAKIYYFLLIFGVIIDFSIWSKIKINSYYNFWNIFLY